ncbi:BTAD domain-containing putative transcriptional regulator [Longispora sp. K20-0274]|uniref:AfsR/SARP family transcriptional regulator n=1 Tax=Longispora sp. K20-0274 TaxID=3088255 RepID=UPI00399AD2C2
MEFRVLGGVEATVDDVAVELGRRRERALLGVLLVHLNTPVSVARLVELLWGDADPARARPALHVHMSRLRRALDPGPAGCADPDLARGADPGTPGPVGGFRLVSVPAGYRLDGDPARVDLHRFRALYDRALAATDPADRADLVDRALTLHRGPLCGPDATDGIRALLRPGVDDLVLSAEELRIAATIDRGRPGDVLADVDRLVRAHPLRERPAALQVRALFRAARRADALAAYERIRADLARTLGLDPGPELRRLHDQLLRGGPRRAVPAQLPPGVAGFTGRAAQLAQLDVLLGPGGPAAIGSVVGAGGVGKTALAVRWAHRVRDRFPDGQLYADLHGYSGVPPVRPLDALTRFLRALGVPEAAIPTDVDEASALYRSQLADRRVLVVLDNARHPDQVRPLLPGGPGSRALVTSRDRLAGLTARDGARRLVLDVLGPDEAVALLAAVIGPDRVAAEPGAAAELVALCGHLPLAIRITAAHLADRSTPPATPPPAPPRPVAPAQTSAPASAPDLAPATGRPDGPVPASGLLERPDPARVNPEGPDLSPALRDVPDPAPALPDVPDPAPALPDVPDPAPGASGVPGAAGGDGWPGGIAGHVARLRAADRLGALELDGDDAASVRVAFDHSHAALEPGAARLFRLLGLVPGVSFGPSAVAALAGVPAPEARRALDRLAAGHLVEARGGERYALHDLLRLYAREHADRHPDDGAAAVRRLYDWYVLGAHAVAGTLAPERLILPVPDTVTTAEPVAFADWDAAMAWGEAERHNLVAAVLHPPARLGPESVWLLAAGLRGHLAMRRYVDDALAVALAGLAAARDSPDPRVRSSMHQSASDAYVNLGRHRESVRHSSEALRWTRMIDLPVAEAACLLAYGRGLRITGRLRAAAEQYEAALPLLAADEENRDGAAIARLNLAVTYRMLGRLDVGGAHGAAALAVFRELRPHLACYAEVGLAAIAQDRGAVDEAEAWAESALDGALRFRNPYLETFSRVQVGAVHEARGRWADAADQYRLALERALAIRDVEGQVSARIGLSQVAAATHAAPTPTRDEPAPAPARDEPAPAPAPCRPTDMDGPGQPALTDAVGQAAEAVRVSVRGDYPLARDQARTALARALRDAGRPGPAVDEARRALAGHRASGFRLAEAWTLALLGGLLADPALVAEAEAICGEIGAPSPSRG